MAARALCLVLLMFACVAARFDPPLHADARALADPRAQGSAGAPDSAQGVIFSCPMDPDVRGHDPGKCRRCGMQLVAGVPDPIEFRVELLNYPAAPVPKRPAALQFVVRDPWKGRAVRDFNRIHEKLFHTFVVSEDLEFFEHGHPTFVADGVFQYPVTFPREGVYRVLADFYPAGASPQLSAQTVIVGTPGIAEPHLVRDYATKQGANLSATLTTIPAAPIAGNRTQVRLAVDAPRGLQQYLGAWAHMLAASSDLIDMQHEHPYRTEGDKEIEFQVTFPRPGMYRLWIQLQSDGVVNTVRFDVPVSSPPADPVPSSQTAL